MYGTPDLALAPSRQKRIKKHPGCDHDRSFPENRLFEIGAIILAVGAIIALIGGYGEVGYIQCIASSGAACTATASTQYITVFLANSEMLSVGLSIVLVGAVIMIGGSITNYLARLATS